MRKYRRLVSLITFRLASKLQVNFRELSNAAGAALRS